MNQVINAVHGRFPEEKFDQVHIHSDNAAQHFKNSKTQRWVSHLYSAHNWIKNASWSFGCPGHGKGVWDGLGGVIKRRLREDITNGTAKIAVPWDCYNHVVRTMDTPIWRANHSHLKVSEFRFHWATTDKFGRPDKGLEYEYTPLTGGHTTRQFVAVRNDVVGMRPFACWCGACRDFSPANSSGSIDGNTVKHCIGNCTAADPESRQFLELLVQRKDEKGIAADRKRA